MWRRLSRRWIIVSRQKQYEPGDNDNADDNSDYEFTSAHDEYSLKDANSVYEKIFG
jgi:hypothetical protein